MFRSREIKPVEMPFTKSWNVSFENAYIPREICMDVAKYLRRGK